MRINGNLVMVGQVKNFRPENLTDDPSSPLVSRIWFNQTEGVFKYFDTQNNIRTFATGEGTLTEYLKLDGSTAMTGDLELSGTDQSGSSDVVAVSKGYLDNQLAEKQDNLTGATSNLVSTNLDTEKAVVSDASGKIIGATNTTAAEIEYLAGVTSAIQDQIDSKEDNIGYVPVNKTGDSMSGNLVMSGNTISGLGQPVNADDAVRLADLEARISGLDFQADVNEIQTDATTDPTSPNGGDRILISDASNLSGSLSGISGLENGDIIEYDANTGEWSVEYDVSTAGSGALVWDKESSTFQYYNGTTWGQFGGLDALNAGVGLRKSGNTINVMLGAGIGQLPTDEVGIEVTPDGGLFNTIDGNEESNDTAATLSIRIDGDGGMATTNAGLKINAEGVTESMLNASVVGNGLTGAAGSKLSVFTAADSGLTVDVNGVSVDDTEMRNRVIYRDGAEAMTGVLTLSSSDQSAENGLAAISKGHLDSHITNLNQTITDLDTRTGQGFYLYEETENASTTHTVTHNMGTRFVGVTVIGSDNEVVIPQSIAYTDENSLVVTFASPETCRVVVNGRKAA